MNDWEISIILRSARSDRRQRIRLLDDLAHFLFGHVDAGVHVREVRNAQAVSGEREDREKTSVRRVIDGSRSGAPVPYAENPTPIAPYAYVARARNWRRERGARCAVSGALAGCSGSPLTRTLPRTFRTSHHTPCRQIHADQPTEYQPRNLPPRSTADVGTRLIPHRLPENI